jgi:hypothetical protein
MGNRYTYVDLELEIPGDLAFHLRDIRGSDNKGSVPVDSDSSGDIRFSRVRQDVVVEGYIDIRKHKS